MELTSESNLCITLCHERYRVLRQPSSCYERRSQMWRYSRSLPDFVLSGRRKPWSLDSHRLSPSIRGNSFVPGSELAAQIWRPPFKIPATSTRPRSVPGISGDRSRFAQACSSLALFLQHLSARAGDIERNLCGTGPPTGYVECYSL